MQAAGGNIALIEVVGDAARHACPRCSPRSRRSTRAFALFIDDLGFDAAGDARALRSMLEGGAEARPANARLIVTSNRRHLVPRDIAEQESAINPRDAVDDHLALADRFGLSLGFHVVDQDGYLGDRPRLCRGARPGVRSARRDRLGDPARQPIGARRLAIYRRSGRPDRGKSRYERRG